MPLRPGKIGTMPGTSLDSGPNPVLPPENYCFVMLMHSPTCSARTIAIHFDSGYSYRDLSHEKETWIKSSLAPGQHPPKLEEKKTQIFMSEYFGIIRTKPRAHPDTNYKTRVYFSFVVVDPFLCHLETDSGSYWSRNWSGSVSPELTLTQGILYCRFIDYLRLQRACYVPEGCMMCCDCTLATLRYSLAWDFGHTISHQLIGIIFTPATQIGKKMGGIASIHHHLLLHNRTQFHKACQHKNLHCTENSCSATKIRCQPNTIQLPLLRPLPRSSFA